MPNDHILYVRYRTMNLPAFVTLDTIWRSCDAIAAAYPVHENAARRLKTPTRSVASKRPYANQTRRHHEQLRVQTPRPELSRTGEVDAPLTAGLDDRDGVLAKRAAREDALRPYEARTELSEQ
jgi:hypothetical protein